MIHFSTDDIAPQDRFEQWREVRGKSLFGVTIELAAERRRDFQGAFSAHQVGNAVASEMLASAYRVSRTDQDIARTAGDSLCIGLQVRGSGVLESGRSRVDSVQNNDMTISYSDLPYRAIPGDHRDFHYRMLKIPLGGDLALGMPADDLFAERYLHAAFSRPFRALFNALSAPNGRLVDPQSDVTHIARLAMVARGRLHHRMPEVRAALRSGVFHAAQDIMARDIGEQRLTPSSVALELGVSVRQLHIVFEHAGRSFSRTLSEMRVTQAKKMLTNMPSLSVTQIAFACGFDSIPTFYRIFKTHCGVAPGEYREANFIH